MRLRARGAAEASDTRDVSNVAFHTAVLADLFVRGERQLCKWRLSACLLEGHFTVPYSIVNGESSRAVSVILRICYKLPMRFNRQWRLLSQLGQLPYLTLRGGT